MDTNSSPLPADIKPPAQAPASTDASPAQGSMPPTSAPVTSVPPLEGTTKKSMLSFSSLPMKLSALVLLSVIVLGAFVISQRNKSTGNMYNVNSNAASVSPTTVQSATANIADQVSGVPTPTVAGEIALTITSPQNGSTVTSPNIVITGKTVPNADVTVNDTNLKADTTGVFSQSVLLDEGDNVISVTSVDPDGNYTERDLKVTLNTSG